MDREEYLIARAQVPRMDVPCRRGYRFGHRVVPSMVVTVGSDLVMHDKYKSSPNHTFHTALPTNPLPPTMKTRIHLLLISITSLTSALPTPNEKRTEIGKISNMRPNIFLSTDWSSVGLKERAEISNMQPDLSPIFPEGWMEHFQKRAEISNMPIIWTGLTCENFPGKLSIRSRVGGEEFADGLTELC